MIAGHAGEARRAGQRWGIALWRCRPCAKSRRSSRGVAIRPGGGIVAARVPGKNLSGEVVSPGRVAEKRAEIHSLGRARRRTLAAGARRFAGGDRSGRWPMADRDGITNRATQPTVAATVCARGRAIPTPKAGAATRPRRADSGRPTTRPAAAPNQGPPSYGEATLPPETRQTYAHNRRVGRGWSRRPVAPAGFGRRVGPDRCRKADCAGSGFRAERSGDSAAV